MTANRRKSRSIHRAKRKWNRKLPALLLAGAAMSVVGVLMSGCSGLSSASDAPQPAAERSGQRADLEKESDAPANTKSKIQTTDASDSQESDSSLSGTDAGRTAEKAEQEEEMEQQIENRLHSMSLEEKAAQIFLVAPESLCLDVQPQSGEESAAVTDASAIEAGFEQIPVAGIILFADNLQSADQIIALNQGTEAISQKRAGLPALIAIDEEGGSVARAADTEALALPRFPDAAEFGAAGNVQAVYEEGKTIGGYLHALGFNVDFAPDADVLTNPDNTVVAKRAYSSNPQLTAEMAAAFAQGLLDQRVLPCYKHFPGHGGTAGDTHEGYAYSNQTLEELQSSELIPFVSAAENEIPMIMAAHISLPQVTGSDVPASLSPFLIQDLLRGQMGYQGVVVSDAMNMGAIADNYDSSQAVLQAIKAGVDLILMPGSLQENWQAVVQAVRSGEISQERLDESVARILHLKAQLSALENER